MKLRGLLAVFAIASMVGGSAFAVSDGNYSPKMNHCSGAADNVESPERAEPGCHNGTVTISDNAGHEYFGIGSAQTGSHETGPIPPVIPFGIGSNLHSGDVWYDSGDGCTRYVYDVNAPGPPEQGDCPWLDPNAPNYYGPNPAPDPSTGIHIYFGFDDNSAGGEHDSSELINNGPSDGGGINIVLDPRQVQPWLEQFAAANSQFILTHPLPVGYAGIGFCADGICMATHTQRQTAYTGGSDTTPDREVYNYDGKRWDPEGCSGDDDGSTPGDNACNDPNDPGTHQDITYWYNQDGTVYVEPGVQFFEDPDPQGSPIGSYPLPALYVGTCGVAIGGGDFQMPDSPLSNHSGQWILSTGC
jgi:hypothetical protein